VKDGLRAVSGLVAGFVGGAIGAGIAIVLAKNDSVLDAELNIHYSAIFGAYGAALGAIMLATNAARREQSSVVGGFVLGAILGGGAGGLGSLASIRSIVEPVLDRGDDARTAFTVAFALSIGALGLCLGFAVGVVRSGVTALVCGVAGAIVGALGGAAYVEFVIFSDSIRSQSDFDTAVMITLTATGAAIGLALGAVHPLGRVAPTGVTPSRTGVRSPTVPPPAEPLPRIPWAPAPVVARPMAAAPPIVEAPPIASGPPRFALRLDDGRSFAVHQRVIVGRDPQRVRSDDTDAVLVSADDGKTISANHFTIMWLDGRLFVEDRGSMSGSIVISPSGVQTRITNGTPMQVGDEWVVQFGTRRVQVLLL
jgi:hypothetical protein